ncbi:Gamma-aminobutyric acid type B receptor subunit 2 [Trichoplax sp. H2]|nr:Gamma-aminobutyric acid type B receptor subunit 2 [Trichoplax sp. H2]|eukprot:RDD39883.1 Gamma-aminobutyric acid type B receptor subunit 2 [Trichoplax sp. H2]
MIRTYPNLIIAVVIVLFGLPHQWSSANQNIARDLYIGGLFPLNDSEWVGTNRILLATQLAVQHVNEDPTLLPDYKLKLIWNGTKSSVPYGLKILYEYVYHAPKKIMLLGSGYSSVTEPIAETSKLWNLVQFSYGATSPSLSDKKKFPFFLRTIPSDASMNGPRVALLKAFQWKKVGLIYQSENIFAVTMEELIKLLKIEGISVLASTVFTNNPKNQIEQLKASDARIIIASFYEKEGRKVMCEAYHQGLKGQKYVWIFLGWLSGYWWNHDVNTGTSNCTREQMIEMVDGHLATDTVSFFQSENGISPIQGQNVQEYMIERNITLMEDHESYGYSNFAYDAIYAMALALNETHNEMQPNQWLTDFSYDNHQMAQTLIRNCYKVNFTGITGPVEFDSKGDRIGVDSITQLRYSNGKPKKVIIGFYYAATSILQWSNNSISWPNGKKPQDSTVMIRSLEYVSTPIYIVMCVLTSFGIVVALIFLFINNYYRKNSFIKISSPRLNNIILVGSVLLYSTVYVLGLTSGDASKTSQAGSKFSTVCVVKTWLPVFGFTLGFGALFAKTYRVYKIFKNKKLKLSLWALTDTHLLGGVCLLLLADIVLLSVWQGVDPLQRVTKDLAEKPILNDSDAVRIPVIELCASRDFSIWLTILYTYKGLLLIAGIYLAWETRKVSIPALNDSRYIGASVYNVVILCAICIPLSTVLEDYPSAAFILMSVFIIFCTTATLFLVFIPKITELKRINVPETITYPNMPITECGSSIYPHRMTSFKEADLLSKVTRLEASLHRKNNTIDELRRLLNKKDKPSAIENINCVTDYTDYDDTTDHETGCASPQILTD